MGQISEIGFVGLGKMGFNMASRVLENSNIKVHVWNRSPSSLKKIEKGGAVSSNSLKQMVKRMKSPRVVWLMLPAGNVTEQKFQEAIKYLKKGDIIIDGGNSNFHDSIRRSETAGKKGIEMLDVGVSGGIVASERGYAMMVGGSKQAYQFCIPAFEAMCMPEGFDLTGEEAGSGHYVKMVHNAIEYGMMQSIAEGFDLLKNGRFSSLDLKKISHIWNHGTIISSFLMEMTEKAFNNNSQDLKTLMPWVDDSGEGEWASIEAMKQKIPFISNTSALHSRRLSRKNGDFAFKLLSAMRNEFGGHKVKKTKGGKK